MSVQATQPGTPALRLSRVCDRLRDLIVAVPRWLRLLLPIALPGLAIWCSFLTPPIPGTSRPPNAILLLSAITLLTVGLTILLRRGLEPGTRDALGLPLPLYPLYLATMALAGTTGAVVLAFAASLLNGLPEIVRPAGQGGQVGVDRSEAILRQAAGAAVTTLVAGAIYSSLPLVLRPQLGGLNARLVASVVATMAMLAGVALIRLLDEGAALGSAAAWRAYLRSPAFGYQILLLCIGPLLPFVALLDNFRSEISWILFLIPLYAIYCLAILGVRLRQRTDQLQQSIAALTTSRQREMELTGYAALVTRAQEEERRRLARELHDDTAQALIALSRGLDTLATRRTHDALLSARDRQFVDELGRLANRSLESIRRACQNLRPSVLDDLGLAAALESLVTSAGAPDRITPSTRCTFTQVDNIPPPCAPEVEVTMYRIAQEALSNALRHARAGHIAVEFGCRGDELRLSVRDDGRGFVPSFPSTGPGDPEGSLASIPSSVRSTAATGHHAGMHLGLMGMRERAALIGATLLINSAPGAGTVVELRLPLRVARSDDATCA